MELNDYSDRRTAPRFELRIPVRLEKGGSPMQALTRDVSATGVYFFMEVSEGLDKDSEIEFTITFPPEITQGTHVRVKCQGKIIRISDAPGYGLGVAAKITKYHFIPIAHA